MHPLNNDCLARVHTLLNETSFCLLLGDESERTPSRQSKQATSGRGIPLHKRKMKWMTHHPANQHQVKIHLLRRLTLPTKTRINTFVSKYRLQSVACANLHFETTRHHKLHCLIRRRKQRKSLLQKHSLDLREYSNGRGDSFLSYGYVAVLYYLSSSCSFTEMLHHPCAE